MSVTRHYLSFEHLASFTVLFVEAGSVMASSPTAPGELWAIVAGAYVLYVTLRLNARHYWILAQELPPSVDEGQS